MQTRSNVRLLFVTPPGIGHAFPVVPVAWAAKSAGHEILVATCGMSIGAVNRAGLQTIAVGPTEEDLQLIYQRFQNSFITASPLRPNSCEPAEAAAKGFFQVIAESMADDLIRKARAWRADIIVHTPQAGAAPIVAAKLSLPSVFLGVGLEQTPQSQFHSLYSRMQELVDRHHVNLRSATDLWLDVTPPSLRRREASGLLMRYIPYSGAGPNPLLPQRHKKRIAVTMGTVAPHIDGINLFGEIIEAAPMIDADFVVAAGTPKPITLGKLPTNMKAYAWMPLDSLLAVSDAIIHHGGSGTTLTACHAGLPQLVTPVGADQFYNAEALRQCGNAIVVDYGQAIDPETFKRLLKDDSLRISAAGVREEMFRTSTPAQAVERIVGLATCS